MRPDAAAVLLADLRAQVDRLVGAEGAVREGRPGAVHGMRVAARRLRSDLTVFGSLLADDRTQDVRHELRWWGRRLGAARDAQVLHERLTALADGAPADVRAALDRDAAAALRRVHVRLDRRRYTALVRTLHDLVDAPRLHPDAARPAHEVLPPRVRAAYDEVLALLSEAGSADDEHDRERLLHEARKAAKRTRYVAEVAGDALGNGEQVVGALRTLQRQLGRHHDVAAARVWLRELASGSGSSTAFWCGRADAVLDAQDVRARGARASAVVRVRAAVPEGRR